VRPPTDQKVGGSNPSKRAESAGSKRALIVRWIEWLRSRQWHSRAAPELPVRRLDTGTEQWLGIIVVVVRRPPSTSYAQSVDAKIAYQVSGCGDADLVLVSGLVSHVELAWQQPSYRRFVRSLERRCRVIRFDKRGTGLSDPTDSPPTIDVRVGDLAAVMDTAKSSSAVLLGVSDGGRGAVGYAASYPDRVAGLVLYGTSFRGPRADLLRRYRSAVRHWGEGRLFDLVAPSAASGNFGPLRSPTSGGWSSTLV
jgi:pimeloyl-ACP methyl ester carboxylesterase